MKIVRYVVALVGAALLLALAGCGTTAFDPTGTYNGGMLITGTSVTAQATITKTSNANDWDFQLAVPGNAYTGSCTHDTATSADNVTCTFTAFGTPSELSGDLKGNTWSGTVSGGISGTFTLTR